MRNLEIDGPLRRSGKALARFTGGPSPFSNALLSMRDKDSIAMRRLDASQRRQHRWTALAIFAVLLFSYSYYPQMHSNANVVSRMALAVSLVKHGTTTINEFAEKTVDKSAMGDNYYSDKAPGQALMATPIVFLLSLLPELPKLPKDYIKEGRFTSRWIVGVHLANIATSGLFTAATAAAIYLLALNMGASAAGALVAAFGFGIASPAWGWAASFFGHAFAGALLFLGFAVTHRLVSRVDSHPHHDLIAALAAGWLLGWSIVVDYTSAPAALFVGLYGMASARRWPLTRLRRVTLAGLGGTVAAIIPLLIYNSVSFGSPLTLSYKESVNFDGFRQGLFGMTYPKLEALYGITFSPYRGVIVFCPLLVLAPFAIYSLARTEEGRGVAYLSACVALYFLLLNSSFHYWEGGWSTGPRYLIPMLPFVFLPYAHYWTSRSSNATRALILALAVLSFGISLVSVSTTMAAPQEVENPLFELLLPQFLHGQVRTVLEWAGWQSGYAVLLHVLVLAASISLIGVSLRWRRPDRLAGHFRKAR